MFKRQNISQLWVLNRGDLNFYVCGTPLWGRVEAAVQASQMHIQAFHHSDDKPPPFSILLQIRSIILCVARSSNHLTRHWLLCHILINDAPCSKSDSSSQFELTKN